MLLHVDHKYQSNIYNCTECNKYVHAPPHVNIEDIAHICYITEENQNEIKIDYGPGTHLHALIKKYLQEDYREGCGCESMVRRMNAWGPEGCREHLDEIMDKMTDAAKDRGWKKRLLASVPLVSRAGMKAMVLLAIRQAEKEVSQSVDDQPPQSLQARPSDDSQG